MNLRGVCVRCGGESEVLFNNNWFCADHWKQMQEVHEAVNFIYRKLLANADVQPDAIVEAK